MAKRQRNYWIRLLDGPKKGELELARSIAWRGSTFTTHKGCHDTGVMELHEYRVVEGGAGKMLDPWRAEWVRLVKREPMPPGHSSPPRFIA